MKQKRAWIGYIMALGSAALVGLFTVLNKWLLVENVPALTAGAWTYFAAGIALLPWALHYRGLKFKKPLVTIGWLLAGSVVGPSLYFIGLQLTSGVEGVLLINTESVFTAFLAFVFFKEAMTGKTLWASIAILSGGIWLSWSGNSLLSTNALGNLLIALGYVGWATENNLGRVLGEDIPPATLVCLKALVAGIIMGILALASGEPITISWHLVPGILASGAFSLGLSLALFYIAMGYIGAGRTGLISSTSMLWGVIGAILLLGESLTIKVIGGGLLMLVGVAVFAWESSRESQ
ncbi:DMT family transporter [Aneurinibacillus sp. Ricciae_BoGa-3]|uniref:DMT family transporter n=1 Tax=Aneurinibacillus sp. Ricciae_BoGa-3 TaxID=3022697 RepID=UPI0023418883|nr:DMT family transporter [Aneurinibacillus sp. Ricciae_BoGa-3]WCK53327.1 DMT family transporter [Aneurinibacillus sp. Ricciae_BoGa-3]